MKSLLVDTLISFLCVGLLFDHIYGTTVIPDESDYSIVYKCFYDHSWLWDKSHHCHVVAYGANKSRFTSREMKLQKMFQQMLVLDRKDRQLVKHCFQYHQFDSSYRPCRGISWKQSRQPVYRDARLARLWKMARQDKRREISRTRFFEGHDSALILECLYTTEWLSKPGHRCHEVAYSGGLRDKAEFTEQDLNLQRMYREQKLHDRVADCFYNHRDDKFIRCYDITWDVTGRITPQSEQMKRMWNQLSKQHLL